MIGDLGPVALKRRACAGRPAVRLCHTGRRLYDGAIMTTSIETPGSEADLSALRREIDAIDLALHEG